MQIAVFKDRVEIRNPGGLFGGLTIEEIRRGNVSKRRNPLVAELLRRIQMVEAWGRGMPLIFKNEPNVKFREVAGIFITSFDRPSFLDGAKETTDKALLTTGKADDLLRFLNEQPEATIRETASNLELTEDGVNYHLKRLQQAGRLKRIGGRKTACWKVVG